MFSFFGSRVVKILQVYIMESYRDCIYSWLLSYLKRDFWTLSNLRKFQVCLNALNMPPSSFKSWKLFSSSLLECWKDTIGEKGGGWSTSSDFSIYLRFYGDELNDSSSSMPPELKLIAFFLGLRELTSASLELFDIVIYYVIWLAYPEVSDNTCWPIEFCILSKGLLLLPNSKVSLFI